MILRDWFVLGEWELGGLLETIDLDVCRANFLKHHSSFNYSFPPFEGTPWRNRICIKLSIAGIHSRQNHLL